VSRVTATQACPTDAYELELREEDRAEVSPGWRTLVFQAIQYGQAVAYRDETGHLIGLVGITQPEPGVASPWALASPRLRFHRKQAYREGLELVRYLREFHADDFICNTIPRAATSNRRFVQALGFRIVAREKGDDIFYLPLCAHP